MRSDTYVSVRERMRDRALECAIEYEEEASRSEIPAYFLEKMERAMRVAERAERQIVDYLGGG